MIKSYNGLEMIFDSLEERYIGAAIKPNQSKSDRLHSILRRDMFILMKNHLFAEGIDAVSEFQEKPVDFLSASTELSGLVMAFLTAGCPEEAKQELYNSHLKFLKDHVEGLAPVLEAMGKLFEESKGRSYATNSRDHP